MHLKSIYKQNIRSSATVGIVENMSNFNGWTSIYSMSINDVRSGDIFDMSATVQGSLLGRNFPAFFAGCLAVCRYNGDYGDIASRPHGVDLSPATGVPYVALTHIGSWVANMDYEIVWPIVWGYCTSIGHQGQTVDIFENGQLIVRHYSTEAVAPPHPSPHPAPPTIISVPAEGLTIKFVRVEP